MAELNPPNDNMNANPGNGLESGGGGNGGSSSDPKPVLPLPAAGSARHSFPEGTIQPPAAGLAIDLNPDGATGKREDYFKMWELNESEDHLIIATHDFAVWLDKYGEIDWQTTPDLDKKIDAQFKHGEISAVLNQVAELQSYPVDYLPTNTKRNFRIMIGEGLARAFDFDPKSAKQMLDKAASFAVARNQELARFWYLGAAAIATGTVAFFALIAWLKRDSIDLIFGKEASQLAFLSCAGGFGSLFSIISRVSRVDLDPAAGRTLHLVEGCARIVIGILGAAIVLLAMRVGLILSMLNEKGTAALLLVALVAGASERLVPTVIKQVETSAASKDQSGSDS